LYCSLFVLIPESYSQKETYKVQTSANLWYAYQPRQHHSGHIWFLLAPFNLIWIYCTLFFSLLKFHDCCRTLPIATTMI
jgi:hypothetical protein